MAMCWGGFGWVGMLDGFGGDVGFWFLDVGALGGLFRAVGAFYGWGEGSGRCWVLVFGCWGFRRTVSSGGCVLRMGGGFVVARGDVRYWFLDVGLRRTVSSGGCVLRMGGGFMVVRGDVRYWFLDVGLRRTVSSGGCVLRMGGGFMVVRGDVGFWFLDVGALGGRFRAVGAFHRLDEVVELSAEGVEAGVEVLVEVFVDEGVCFVESFEVVDCL